VARHNPTASETTMMFAWRVSFYIKPVPTFVFKKVIFPWDKSVRDHPWHLGIWDRYRGNRRTARMLPGTPVGWRCVPASVTARW
jgi:hypothetical protein